MLRRLLTLLAVISGLALAEGPAVAAHGDIVSMAQAVDSADCALPGARPAQPRRGSTARAATAPVCPLAPVALPAPGVQLKADRARE